MNKQEKKERRRVNQIARAKSMKDLGYNNRQIAKALGVSESDVRAILPKE